MMACHQVGLINAGVEGMEQEWRENSDFEAKIRSVNSVSGEKLHVF